MAVGEDGFGGVCGVLGGDVGAVELVGGGGEGEVWAVVPLEADFVVFEFFWVEGAVGEGEGGELLACAWDVGHGVAGVEGEWGDGLVDEACAWGDEVVLDGDGAAVAVVAEVYVEDFVAEACDGLELGEDFDLVLDVEGEGIGYAVVGGIGGALAEGEGEGGAGVGDGDFDGGGLACGGEVACFAEVVGDLAAKLEACEELVLDGASFEGEGEVCLVEEVLAVCGVVVGGDGGFEAVCALGDGAWEDVLVEFVVVAVVGVVAEAEVVVEGVVELGEEGVDFCGDGALGGVTEEGGFVCLEGAALVGGDAAIGYALVFKVFVACGELGAGRDLPCGGGVEAVALDSDGVAEAFGVFVEASEAEGEGVAEGLGEVEGGAVFVPAASLEGELAEGGAVGDFGDAVDDAA